MRREMDAVPYGVEREPGIPLQAQIAGIVSGKIKLCLRIPGKVFLEHTVHSAVHISVELVLIAGPCDELLRTETVEPQRLRSRSGVDGGYYRVRRKGLQRHEKPVFQPAHRKRIVTAGGVNVEFVVVELLL